MKARIEWFVTAEIEIADAVVDGVLNDEWRATFYPLHTREDVVEHIARNALRGNRLSILDGFADRSDDEAKLTAEEWELTECEVLGSTTPSAVAGAVKP